MHKGEGRSFEAPESPSFPNRVLSDRYEDDNGRRDTVPARHGAYTLAGEEYV